MKDLLHTSGNDVILYKEHSSLKFVNLIEIELYLFDNSHYLIPP